jgi:DNA mismatch endonuclease (patch repair protein)
MMSGIRGKDTKPELAVRSYLHRAGLRFRLHAHLPGKPDLVFPKHDTVVFVHGCFWHRHKGCSRAATPKTRTDWWMEKLELNVARDRKNLKALRKLGWKVLTIWECETEDSQKLETLAAKIKGTA